MNVEVTTAISVPSLLKSKVIGVPCKLIGKLEIVVPLEFIVKIFIMLLDESCLINLFMSLERAAIGWGNTFSEMVCVTVVGSDMRYVLTSLDPYNVKLVSSSEKIRPLNEDPNDVLASIFGVGGFPSTY